MPDESKPKAVRNLRAPTADAIAKLQNDYDLDDATRAYLIAKVEKSGFGGVIVDAHEANHEGATHLHASITKLFIALLLPLLIIASTGHGAITSSNMVTYAATGGASTNTGTPVLIGYAYIQSSPSFIISDGGTATTNALTVNIRYGLDTNNFSTIATYTKSGTNATEGVVTPGTTKIPIYAQTQVITTKRVTVGTKTILQQ